MASLASVTFGLAIAVTTTATASAAVHAAAARPASARSDVRPDVNSALLYYGGTHHNSYACHYNTNYPARASGYTRIVNECSVRVWLKGPDGNWCSTGGTAENVPAVYSDPSIVQISSNKSHC